MISPVAKLNPVYSLEQFMDELIKKNPGEEVFHQAVREFAEVVIPYINEHLVYSAFSLMERLTEPDRVLSFKVTWMNDAGEIKVNKAYRVQFNNSIGPYKGGLRFHPSVNLGLLKFLGFEQIFKNSLTTLPMGGGKGGSDFNPKGKSDNEVMRFCQAFMTELYRHIGADVDVPAGDIGVGGREIGYLFGQYKKLRNEHTGVLTGKGHEYGGSNIRPQATGYGCVYFAEYMLKERNLTIEGKECIVSGSGNVAQYTVEKLINLGAKVLSVSDSGGAVYMPNGMTNEQLEWMKELKNIRRGRIAEFANQFDLVYMKSQKPWGIKAEMAFPSATQNEILKEDAYKMIENGVIAVAEGANMPTSMEAIKIFQNSKIMYAPGKASNAGGVATSGLEMTQNSQRLSWTSEEVDTKLKLIMGKIHNQCKEHGITDDNGVIDYVKGANIAGFIKVAKAVIAQGV